MEKNKNKNLANKSIMTLLVVIIIALLAIGLIAWSRYRTTINGSASATSAQWSFKLTGADGTETQTFSLERTDENTSVADGVIAPGTYGKLEIGLDATGTQTALTYSIDASINDKPINLKLYSDEERTMELIVIDEALSKAGYMPLAEVGKKTETIYWEWPEETVSKPVITDEKLAELNIDTEEYNTLIEAKQYAEANDMIDTAEMGKQILIAVSVTAKQLIGEPVLADLVQVGDYVNYDASSNGSKTFASSDCADLAGTSISATISTDNDFNSAATAQWRVLSVDRQTKTVELVATAQTVTLTGDDGFVNTETVLNKIGAIYGQGKGATGGRSIKLEDIEQYSSYDPYTYKNSSSSTRYYGGTREYTSGSFYKEIKDENGNITYETTKTTASSSSPIEMTQTDYRYFAKDYFLNSRIHNMLFKKSTDVNSNKPDYWLASCCVILFSDYCDFTAHGIGSDWLFSPNFYNSKGGESNPSYACMPVVSLKSNIQTSGKDENGVWKLKVD